MGLQLKQVRCILELAVAVWAAGLNLGQVAQIERVQKTVCSVILGTNYRGYENALKVLEISKLSERREVLCLNFAKKAIKNDKYQHWFVVNEQNQLGMQTRSGKSGLKTVETRTNRYRKSAIPYLTNLLNDNWKHFKLD